jgi:hypothetical protein
MDRKSVSGAEEKEVKVHLKRHQFMWWASSGPVISIR